MLNHFTGTARINILSAEINFRKTAAQFSRQSVPKFTGENIEQNFVAQERTADAQRNNHVRIVAQVFSEIMKALNAGGRIEIEFAVLLSDVRKF